MKHFYFILILAICVFLISCKKKGVTPQASPVPGSEDHKSDIIPSVTPTLPPNYIYQQKSDGTYSAVQVKRIDAKTVFPKGDGSSMLDYKVEDNSYFNETEVWWMLDSQKEVRFPAYSEAESLLQERTLSELQGRNSLGLINDAKSFSMRSGMTDGTIINDLSTGIKPQFVKTKNNKGYFAFKIEGGFRLFKFFYKDSFGKLQYTGYPILVKKPLELMDFMNIKIGDTIDDVAAIDPVADIYKSIYDQYPDSSLVLQKGEEASYKLRVFSCHLCRDCAIEFVYTRDADGQYKIIDIWKDGNYRLYIGNVGASWSFEAQIFPEDYPDE